MTTPLNAKQRVALMNWWDDNEVNSSASVLRHPVHLFAVVADLLAAERERADREKARADALIANVRAMRDEYVEYAAKDLPIDPQAVAVDLDALLPDDTKED